MHREVLSLPLCLWRSLIIIHSALLSFRRQYVGSVGTLQPHFDYLHITLSLTLYTYTHTFSVSSFPPLPLLLLFCFSSPSQLLAYPTTSPTLSTRALSPPSTPGRTHHRTEVSYTLPT
ncbi:hypothetical protein LZ31DRAFT_179132 [Colletotrichum somersetense]|nr:hypothetical protein LZ31DRAFT_179132 [Colletotrichum somersetense]